MAEGRTFQQHGPYRKEFFNRVKELTKEVYLFLLIDYDTTHRCSSQFMENAVPCFSGLDQKRSPRFRLHNGQWQIIT